MLDLLLFVALLVQSALTQHLPPIGWGSHSEGQQPLQQQPDPSYRPIVLWHGMGDSCCDPDSLERLTEMIQRWLPGVFIYSVQLGDSLEQDRQASFFGLVSSQIQEACDNISGVPELANGFNAIGFSQGGLFLRAVVQQCLSSPPIHTLLTFGSPHGGVSDIPNCADRSDTSCSIMRSIVRTGVYWPWVQKKVVQAQYFKRYTDMEQYLSKSAFLADINNDRDDSINTEYAKRLRSLDKFIMVRFENDTMIAPKDTAWFSFYNAQGELQDLKEQLLYKEDRLGLKSLDKSNSLVFSSLPGNHLKFSDDQFEGYIRDYFSQKV
ncbi:hypothetical protein BATDEDRAFT_86823 [Batrachochytrium dendrobatidis JAM81]|uniref:Palmitoyl-protein thioesterase 1 n=2 Tax=Batrachochytrium dendrobatidis TaxID=109871 RepID=F4NYV0_BATDJ|nr:uncharacterized protein BATDEDRAFT_86823 [Batrachochytrium dendrobatidis JAM81]EGF81771.1 hypothetical protein BATDEDRAFT_86823 [Batrachochytrium dendrobatidis JAM81]OAJ40290.1 hypothetical protein, variant [Batrachochytrium dendrobatidis JEL423]|eukprot:XP_006677521.1 hypothetical protein BATDEDRAFT_86823 [Batrachochytrium dendrobatidis JAM81]